MPNKNTLFIGKVVHAFQALPSTNSFAKELLAKSKPIEGTVISAATQTAGRGQIGSKWESPEGQSLSLSVILYPHFLLVRKQFELNIVAALAVRDALMPFASSEVVVKWPNDVYLGSRKVAGILIQNQIAGQQLQYSIVGTGININQPEFSPELPYATSLLMDTGERQELDTVASHYLHALEQRYLQLRSGTSRLKRDYYGCLLGYQEKRTYRLPNGDEFEAEAAGIDELGHLLLRLPGGGLQAYALKEVSLVPDIS